MGIALTKNHLESLESTMSFRTLLLDGIRRPPADVPEDEVAAVVRRVRSRPSQATTAAGQLLRQAS
jgi:hypothetical protein